MKIITILSLFNVTVLCKYYSCDYKFGDPSWSYSQIFYNESHIIPPGIDKLEIFFETNLMISFVCVNVTDVTKDSSNVSFSSLFKRLTIKFDKPQDKNVTADVLAMHHGYRRHSNNM